MPGVAFTMDLGWGDPRQWFGTGWLLTVTVVWVIASLWSLLYFLALANAPQGGIEVGIYGLRKQVYDTAALATLFGVPLGIGWVAYAAGFGRHVCLLYLLPHGIAVAARTVTVTRRRINRRRRARRARIDP